MSGFYKQILLVFSMALLPFIGQAQTEKTLLWEITGDDLDDPSYLYGTIHIMDKRVFAFNDSVVPKIEQCPTFAMEIDMNPANMMKAMSAFMLKDGKTLKDLYTEEEYEFIKTEFQKRTGMSIIMFTSMQPIGIVSLVSLEQFKKDMATPVDIHLRTIAKEAGKETVGIETIEEQTNALSVVPNNVLLEMFKDWDKQAEMAERMVSLYLDKDLDAMLKFSTEDDLYAGAMEKILDERNVRMAERILKMARENGTFAAIGAAHLPGDIGVIELIRKEGYTVSPIIAKHTPVIEDQEEEKDKKEKEDK